MKKCACGKEIIDNRKKYCSIKCKEKTKKEKNMIYKICPTCGTKFESYKYSKVKHCSRKCAVHNPAVQHKKNESCRKTNLEKYGVEHHTQSQDIINKRKKTCLVKYGVDSFSKTDECKQKFKETNIKKFGVDNPMKSDEIKNKGKKTNLKKYGVENVMQNEEIRKRVETTNKEKYGFKTATQNEEVKDKIKKTCKKISKKQHEKRKITLNEKYGVENVSQILDVIHKVKRTQYNKTYNRILIEYKNHVIPLFNIDEYNGSGYDKLYRFKCVKCANEFEHWVNNGVVPRCQKCYPIQYNKSKYEDEIEDFLKTLISNKIITNSKKIISPLELDIYIPDKKIAIEFNGIYWHSEISGGKDRKYHLRKTEECEEKGIRLIHIFENEWLEKQEIVKGVIKGILGMSDNRVYARDCEVRELNTETKDRFLMENHLQGKDVSGIRYGLYWGDELVSVMTFSRSRFDKKVEYEMYRYATKVGYSVIGGASRLFSRFIKDYDPESVVTYADRRYFDGGVYEKLGFRFMENTNPNYYYFNLRDPYTLENRVKYQKHKLSEILNEYKDSLTEWENMQVNGFDRIWDCGNKKFIWKK